MKKKLLLIPLALLLALSLVAIGCLATPTPPSPPARAIDAIVSTQWLEDNIDNLDLVILDVREPDYYTAGHIPGSVNVPAFPNWMVNLFGEEWPWMELPEDEALFTTIGNAGITADSTVVVIARTVDSPSSGPAPSGVTFANRVTITLIYAGVEHVAMLDGGYDLWAVEERAISTEPVTPTAVTYTGVVDETIFVSKDYVEDKVGKSILVDATEPDVYFGIEQWAGAVRAGHIPTAKDLPAPWFWATTVDEAGVTTYITWKDTSTIREMAITVLGEDGDEEIIVYCGVGGYASPLWYVLTQVVGYRNVKFYDGSMQEWSADPSKDVIKYKYE
ncbi:MAG TPA: sulfurtransferase [Dehalococcoidia bacterium]|nr:sulfurtransferase [Dehalococcoidia bacterium]